MLSVIRPSVIRPRNVAPHQVHPLSSFVMRNGNWPQGKTVFGLDQPLHPVGDGIEGVEDVEEPATRGERKIRSERFDSANGQVSSLLNFFFPPSSTVW